MYDLGLNTNSYTLLTILKPISVPSLIHPNAPIEAQSTQWDDFITDSTIKDHG